MKITKYTHSCLLVEENNISVLIDPGIYSTPSISLDTLSNLDYLLITHEHSDHFDPAFIKQLITRFPQMRIIATESIVKILKKDDITVTHQGNENIAIEDIEHEHIFGVQKSVENSCFTILSKLTHPGDSLKFNTTQSILALPMQAPWGNTTEILEKAYELKPQYIIPIHDWHWHSEARDMMYRRAVEYFKTNNITFIPLENNIPYSLK